MSEAVTIDSTELRRLQAMDALAHHVVGELLRQSSGDLHEHLVRSTINYLHENRVILPVEARDRYYRHLEALKAYCQDLETAKASATDVLES